MDSLIAPCGIDCSHCSAYLTKLYGPKGKWRSSCVGCRARDKKCAFLKRRCELLRKHRIDFCYECDSFPCEQLEKLEARYVKAGYATSFIENNRRIKKIGSIAFLKEQAAKFTCSECGGPVCLHDLLCYKCGHKNKAGEKE
jgi:hypothetical protein